MNNKEIQELISCEKTIVERPKRSFKQNGMHEENSFLLKSFDFPNMKFSVRMRKHLEFIENYSIMLASYIPELEKEIRLIRFNGPHPSMHKNNIINNEKWDHKSHIHIATKEAIEAGFQAEHYAEITEEYQIFDDALSLFWEKVNIVDRIENFFPEISQKKLFNIRVLR